MHESNDGAAASLESMRLVQRGCFSLHSLQADLQGWGGALQVFDKALTETTFCEIYADLCFQLNTALPSFEPPSQDATKRPPSTFRSALPAQHAHACSLLSIYMRANCSERQQLFN